MFALGVMDDLKKKIHTWVNSITCQINCLSGNIPDLLALYTYINIPLGNFNSINLKKHAFAIQSVRIPCSVSINKIINNQNLHVHRDVFDLLSHLVKLPAIELGESIHMHT